MAARMSRRLMLVSSAVVTVIYAAGYWETRTANASLAVPSPKTTATGSSTSVATTTVATSSVATTTSNTTAPIQTAPGLGQAIAQAPIRRERGDDRGRGDDRARYFSGISKQSPTNAATIKSTTTTTTSTATSTPHSSKPAMATVAGKWKNGVFTGTGDSRRGSITVALTVSGGRITNITITDATTQYPTAWVNPLVQEVLSRQGPPVDYVSGATFSSLAFRGAIQQALIQAQA